MRRRWSFTDGDIYTNLAEAVKAAGNIGVIGVVTGPGTTAVSYAGAEVLRRYYDGTKQMAVVFSISGADTNDRQEELIKTLCKAGADICSAGLTVAGLGCIKCEVVSPPVATVHDEHYWIYMTQVRVKFMYKT